MLARGTGYAHSSQPAGVRIRHADRHHCRSLLGGWMHLRAAGGQRALRHRPMERGRGASDVDGAAGGDHNGSVDLCSNRHPADTVCSPNKSVRNLKEEAVNLNFPYQFDGRGRTREAALQDYVTQLVEQVLFTSPGERVNLPDFGSGLLQLPFAPNSVEMAAATQFTVQAALQRWLGSYVKVQSVVASAHDAILTVTVTYSLLNTDVTQVQTFVSGATS